VSRRTLTAQQLADALGVSPWSIYEAVKRGDCPVRPIRVGRRLVFPRPAVEALLGPIEVEAP
jgi:predicted DNA-binding transcriptional regulator AlpA